MDKQQFIDSVNQLTGKELVEAAIKTYGHKVALLSAFNPEDVIISHWIAQVDPTITILFLDTQKHFPETLQYVDRVTQQLGLKNVNHLTPDPKRVHTIDKEGVLWQTQVNRCCWLRKVEPLERAINQGEFDVLITGRRMEQNAHRLDMRSAEFDENGHIKVNPLRLWTRKERDAFMDSHGLPHHPLYALGYLSIGCAPCTTPVYVGEEERAGRWRHTRLNVKDGDAGKTECGLHVAQNNES